MAQKFKVPGRKRRRLQDQCYMAKIPKFKDYTGSVEQKEAECFSSQ